VLNKGCRNNILGTGGKGAQRNLEELKVTGFVGGEHRSKREKVGAKDPPVYCAKKGRDPKMENKKLLLTQKKMCW